MGATAEQIKALIESFGEDDDDRFFRTALQIAAHEGRRGNRHVAADLMECVDAVREKRAIVPLRHESQPVPIHQPRGELEGLLTVSFPEYRLSMMVLEDDTRGTLKRLLKEHRHAHRLREHGLEPRRKILLAGPPGTGKTMTGQALAGELQLPLFLVRLEGLITRFMGETAAKLRLVFDAMYEHRGVYLFDEFDAIGAQRATGNDVGEIRRVLNSFLQFIEQDNSQSIIVAATNHASILDRALFRRFDDVIEFHLPDCARILEALQEFLAPFTLGDMDWDAVASIAVGLSYAELRRACEDAAKDAILSEVEQIAQQHLETSLLARQQGVSLQK